MFLAGNIPKIMFPQNYPKLPQSQYFLEIINIQDGPKVITHWATSEQFFAVFPENTDFTKKNV